MAAEAAATDTTPPFPAFPSTTTHDDKAAHSSFPSCGHNHYYSTARSGKLPLDGWVILDRYMSRITGHAWEALAKWCMRRRIGHGGKARISPDPD